MTTFADLGVRPRTLESLNRRGITAPKNVQTEALPALLERRDTVIEAPTGSGKTLAFAIPLVERLSGHGTSGARALIVTPTRELASQINDVIRGVDNGLRTALVVGGVGYGKQTGQLRNSPDVVIGCPGRILDLANQGIADFRRVEYLVLDEADEMLDQGFARDVEKIIALLPTHGSAFARQTVLASATMPGWVQTMIDKHLVDPARVRAMNEQLPALEHGILNLTRDTKLDALGTLLNRQVTTELPQTLVFHRTKHGAKKLARDLLRLGYKAGELQGNLSQNARDRAIGDFRNGSTTVLVATNVAARGIDVAGIGLVVNFELPETAQWLTHRIGRTARNGRTGRAITMLTSDDSEQWHKLRRLGAPALPTLDTRALLDSNEWTYVEGAPEPVHVHHRTQGPRRQPQGGRRTGLSDRPSHSAGPVRTDRSAAGNPRRNATPGTGGPRPGERTSGSRSGSARPGERRPMGGPSATPGSANGAPRSGGPDGGPRRQRRRRPHGPRPQNPTPA